MPGKRLVTRINLISLLTIISATASMELLGDRHVWCACKSWIPWSWDIWSSHNSQHLVDPYSLSHLLHGFIFYALFKLCASHRSVEWRLIGTTVLESAWELLENSPLIIERYRAVTAAQNYFGDSLLNSLSDIAACILGFMFAARSSVRLTVLLLLLIETSLLLLIRDNLTLNILMLIYPLDAIRAWQME